MAKSKRNGSAALILKNQGAGAHPGGLKTSKSPRNTSTELTRGLESYNLSVEAATNNVKGSSKTTSSSASARQAQRIIDVNAGKVR